MSIKQKIAFYITTALLLVPLFAVAFASPAQAFKCTGSTDGRQHYYRNGACYQPVGDVCLDSPAPANPEDCVNRDTTRDLRITDEKPVNNDGSEVTEWNCPSGTYNASKHVCESCNSFGACQTIADAKPTPSGQDTTEDSESSSIGKKNTLNEGGAGECAGEKTDFLACDGEGADAVVSLIKIFITTLSIGVGIVAVAGIVYGAILYSSAQDNEEQTRKGVAAIRNVLIGLFLYMFMVAIINSLVPGGVFSGDSSSNNNQSGNSNNSNSNNNNNNRNGNSN